MIYRAEDIYKKIKDGPEITSESEFINLYRPESGDPSITDEMLFPAFFDLRLSLGQNFKLDHIYFLLGNGCSIYAGSKSTTEFKMSDAVDEDKLEEIQEVIAKLTGKSMEEQLNALLTVQELLHGISRRELLEHYPALEDIQYINTDDYNKEEIVILLAKELIKRYR